MFVTPNQVLGDVVPLSRATKPLPDPFRRAATALLALIALCPAVYAQKHKQHKVKPAVDIIAIGKVLHAGAPVEGAVVYLENPKSLTIKSYLTVANGGYHFSNLSPETDYEVWAEQNGIQSKHKFISQFSSHSKFEFTLKLEPEKKHKFLGIF